jgi:hypothetical protein
MRTLERLSYAWWLCVGRLGRARRRLLGRRACPCCGFFTLESASGHWEVCEVCFWDDDPVQLAKPGYEGGANTVSLNDARENFRKFGASEPRFKDNVRPPRPKEIPRGKR